MVFMADEVNDITSIQVSRDPTWVGLQKVKAEMIEKVKKNVSYDEIIQMLLAEHDSKKGNK
jgi:hypothetical protein